MVGILSGKLGRGERRRAPFLDERKIASIRRAILAANNYETRPTINIRVQASTEMKALYDTGAAVTVMSEQAFLRIPQKCTPPRLIGEPIRLTGADDKPMVIRGCYETTLRIQGRVVKQDVYVVSALSSDFIIGCDLIHDHGLSYDAEERTVFYKDRSKWKEGGMVARARTRLPAQSSVPVRVRVQERPGVQVTKGGIAVAEINCTAYPIGGNDGLVTVNDAGETFMMVDNMLDSEVIIPRGTFIGAIERVPEASELVLDEEDRPKEQGPGAKCEDKEKLQMLEDIIAEQVKELPMDLQKRYKELILRNHDVFSKDKSELGLTTEAEHSITLKDDEPVYVKQFRLAETDRSVLLKHLRTWLKLGVVSPCRSKYNSPIFLVPKKDGTMRPVLDFRAVNEKSHVDKYSQLEVNECIDAIGRAGSTVFSSIDLTAGFWQVPMEKGSREYTAFTIPGIGSFQWNRCPMGLLGSPATFGRMMEHIMRLIKCICYQDDILVHSSSHEEQLEVLQKCFDRLRAANLKMNAQKCFFGQNEVSYLGYTLTSQGVLPGKEKTAAIQECAPPSTTKQIREFTGLCNYFRASIKNFSELTAPLHKLTRNNSGWKGGELPTEALKAFKTLQEKLISPEVLAYPNPDLDYHLVVDASAGSDDESGGLGASLIQIHEGIPRPIGYVSRRLAKHERNYSSFLVEMAACCFGIEQFEVHLKGRKFYLYTDHRPLEKLSKVHTRTLHRLQQLMNEYEFVIKYKPGKDNVVADFLSRNPISAIDIHKSDLVRLQAEDELIKQILAERQTPEGREKLGRLKDKLVVMHDVLFFKKDEGGLAIFTPQTLTKQIIQSAHNSLVGGHMGLFKSKERILEKYYWPSMTKDIKEHIDTCTQCQATKPWGRDKRVPLKPLPQPINPNHRIHIDLFGPLATSGSGKKYVMAITDSFTKYVELIAIPNKEARTVAKAIMDVWITRYSTPAEILTDGGKEFANKLLDQLCMELSILHKQTSPYHPQCNAQVEVFNRTMKHYLQNALQAPYLDWEELLPALRICYNTSVSKATRKTPFSLLFGMKARMPVFDLEESISYDESGNDSLKMLRAMRRQAEECNLKYKGEYEKQYNKKYDTKTSSIAEGEWIMIENSHRTGPNPKLHKAFLGPFIVRRADDSDVWYEEKGRIKVAHIDRVKRARMRSETQVKAEQERSARECTQGAGTLRVPAQARAVVDPGKEGERIGEDARAEEYEDTPLPPDDPFPPTPARPFHRSPQRTEPEDIHMQTIVEEEVDHGVERKRKPSGPAGERDGCQRVLRSRGVDLGTQKEDFHPFVTVPPYPIESAAYRKRLALSKNSKQASP